MERRKLRELVSILRESPFYEQLSAPEKRDVIKSLSESYPLFSNGGELDRYQAGWVEMMRPFD